jgi:hypothetical protein
MKRQILRTAATVFALSMLAGCGHHEDGESITHQFGKDFFGAGPMLSLTDPIDGDAFLAAGQVAIAAEVRGDLVVAGGELSLGGSVGDDLYAAGGDVDVDAIVRGNARVAGGDISVGPATVIEGAVSLSGGQISFEGDAQEYLQASGGSVRLAGSVQGDAQVRSQELTISPDTRIRGKLIYHGPQAPVVPEGAQIEGGVEFHEVDASQFLDKGGDHVRDAVHGVGKFLWFAGVFLTAALFTGLFPVFSSRASLQVGREPFKSLGLGLAILLCVPFLAVFLLITVIGIPLALLLLPLYLLLLFLGWVTVALFVANKGLETVRGAGPTSLGWRLLALLLALVALWLIGRIPVVGGLLTFLALIAGIGALVSQVWGQRPATSPAS